MALLNGTKSSAPAPSDNSDLTGDTDNATMNGEDTSGADTDSTGDDSTDGDDDQPTVLCTVMLNSDGSYVLVTGDEDDTADGLAAPEGASPAEGGTPAPPPGQTFDSEGALLKAILDLLRDAPGNGDTDSGAQSSFEDGFTGGKKPSA